MANVKTYVDGWVGCKTDEEARVWNSRWMIDGVNAVRALVRSQMKPSELLPVRDLSSSNFVFFDPLHEINGIEVVAPRFDDPEDGQPVWVLDGYSGDGGVLGPLHHSVNATYSTIETYPLGWFASEDDGRAYAGAIRDGKPM